MGKHILEVVHGSQWGDEGKGKVVDHKLKNQKFDWCVRFQGGDNAGHTFYVEIEGVRHKLDTHILPSGVASDGVRCLISTGCVIHLESLDAELGRIEKVIPGIRDRVFISKYAHIVTDESQKEDAETNKVGTTCRGIGQTYSKKALRTNQRVGDLGVDSIYGCGILDPYKLFMDTDESYRILVEGAQGFELDIDHGGYPCVTSSITSTYYLGSTCLDLADATSITGCAKAYGTYVGSARMQEDDYLFELLQSEGKEFGTTTGRKRQCMLLDLDRLLKSVRINKDTTLVFNKCDILDTVNKILLENPGKSRFKTAYNLVADAREHSFDTMDEFSGYIRNFFAAKKLDIECIFSFSPYMI